MAAQTIEAYLADLRSALNGADPATIQDALADAEDHLTTALAETAAADPEQSAGAALETVISAYGAPEEIAAAYRDIETRVRPALALTRPDDDRGVLARIFGVYADPRAWGALIYMFISLATGLVYFTWAVVGLSLSVSLAIFIFGLPLAAFFLLSSRWFGLLEGRIVEALLGVRMPRRPAFFPKGLTWQRRLAMLFIDRNAWVAVLYMVLQLVFGVVYFTVFTTLVALSLSLIAAPVVQLITGEQVMMMTLEGTRYLLSPAWLPLISLAGFLIATGTMHLAKGIGTLHGRYARAVLISD